MNRPGFDKIDQMAFGEDFFAKQCWDMIKATTIPTWCCLDFAMKVDYWHTKMDGENNGKPYEQMDVLG